MTIQEMQQRKRELGYTNEMIAELSGVPLATVQKLFAGLTKAPRRKTIEALEKVLVPDESGTNERKGNASYNIGGVQGELSYVCETAPRYLLNCERSTYGGDPKQGSYTVQDYYALPKERRVELIDGYIYDMASPTREHQTILMQMALQLSLCVDAHPGCRLYIAPLDVCLFNDERTMVQPDIFIFCKEDDGDTRRINGVPDFIAEILSPSNRFHDMFRKLNLYRLAGVREYWLVDPEARRVTVYNFEKEELPTTFSFADSVPVLLSEGKCGVNFARISEVLERYEG